MCWSNADPRFVADLVALTDDSDWLVAQRAFDLLEKLSREHPQWIAPHKAVFIGPLASSGRLRAFERSPSKALQARARQIRARLRSGTAPKVTRAAVGFTVKSGWASAVMVGASRVSPRVMDSRRMDLSDPAIPESRQPYHAGFGTARQAGPGRARLIAAVKRYGRKWVAALVREHRAAGHAVHAAGLVVGSLIDPERIANDHIRIHALEGQLFRRVVHDAASRNRLTCSIWREQNIWAAAADALKQPERTLREVVMRLGRDVDGPWRAEQKAAALAAWLALA